MVRQSSEMSDMNHFTRTIVPQVQGDVAEAVSCTYRSCVTAHLEVAELVEAHSQVAILATECERGI